MDPANNQILLTRGRGDHFPLHLQQTSDFLPMLFLEASVLQKQPLQFCQGGGEIPLCSWNFLPSAETSVQDVTYNNNGCIVGSPV